MSTGPMDPQALAEHVARTRAECEHGGLRRKCDVCALTADLGLAELAIEQKKALLASCEAALVERDETIAALRERVAALEAALWKARDAVQRDDRRLRHEHGLLPRSSTPLESIDDVLSGGTAAHDAAKATAHEAGRRAGLEEAAALCEAYGDDHCGDECGGGDIGREHTGDRARGAYACAEAIRALARERFMPTEQVVSPAWPTLACLGCNGTQAKPRGHCDCPCHRSRRVVTPGAAHVR